MKRILSIAAILFGTGIIAYCVYLAAVGQFGGAGAGSAIFLLVGAALAAVGIWGIVSYKNNLAWTGKSEAAALKAVERLTDNGKLCQAAMESPHAAVGLAAVARLGDERSLFSIAAAPRFKRVDVGARRAAMLKLSEAALNDFLKSKFADDELQQEALGRISDSELLNDAAKTAYQASVREAACQRLGGHIYPNSSVPGAHACVRCRKEMFVLDEAGQQLAARYATPETRDDWHNEARYTRYKTKLTERHCSVCGTVTPCLQTELLEYEIYRSTSAPVKKTTVYECLVCHNQQENG